MGRRFSPWRTHCPARPSWARSWAPASTAGMYAEQRVRPKGLALDFDALRWSSTSFVADGVEKFDPLVERSRGRGSPAQRPASPMKFSRRRRCRAARPRTVMTSATLKTAPPPKSGGWTRLFVAAQLAEELLQYESELLPLADGSDDGYWSGAGQADQQQ